MESIKWQIHEEKEVYSKDREYIIITVSVTIFILALLFKFYIFSLFILMAGFTVIYSGRKTAREFNFELNEEGFKSNDTEYLYDKILAFSVIDDPGERARLILKLKALIGTVAIPIFDRDIQRIKKFLQSKKINEDEDLKFNIFDKLATYL